MLVISSERNTGQPIRELGSSSLREVRFGEEEDARSVRFGEEEMSLCDNNKVNKVDTWSGSREDQHVCRS